MLRYLFVLCSIVLISSCSHPKQFERESWLKNNDVNDTGNPRAYMTEDLLKNYLKTGLSKDSIIALLGKPYSDKIEQRLPKGMSIPDSISYTNSENIRADSNGRIMNQINEFMRLNSQPDTLMLYPVGWSTIDPNFLVVKLDDQGQAIEFWIEQH
ncbi:hypothetical protein WG906_04425 [Pedobacter sp. P351]|uniref:hypothetical protein n=1 Tax=Pedobacter superstes TaxID=3133441 RepID=UPI0030971C97